MNNFDLTNCFISASFNSLDFVVNNKCVFRFPVNTNISKDIILKEIGIINNIKKYLSIPISNIKLAEINGGFFSYHNLIKNVTYYEFKIDNKENIIF